MDFSGRVILLDIEGTTSSVRYVYDILFPYAREHVEAYVRRHWTNPELQQVVTLMARDAGYPSLAEWSAQGIGTPEGAMIDLPEAGAHGLSPEESLVVSEANRLMDGDVKATGLKALQGLIWKEGYAAGQLKSHVYDDVPPCLKAWKDAGRSVCIYSSGSVAAQQVFFANTDFGDLLGIFDAHYDATIGGKKEAASYRAIAQELGTPAGEILFLSDVPAELAAAQEAGMQVGLVVRPDNAPVEPGHSWPTIHDFREVVVQP